QAGSQGGKAGHIESGFALGLGAAKDHVVDLRLVQRRNALHGPVDGDGGQIVGAGSGEGAFGGAADGGADGADENGFGHWELLRDQGSGTRDQKTRGRSPAGSLLDGEGGGGQLRLARYRYSVGRWRRD